MIICDGNGLAHSRRFGLACHIGILYDIPTIGCAKNWLLGSYIDYVLKFSPKYRIPEPIRQADHQVKCH